MKKQLLMILIMVIAFTITDAKAQYNYDNRLKLEISPFVWMTTINGNLTVNGEPRKVNFTFEDFFKYSNLGLSGHIEVKKGNWGLLFDWIYVDLLKDQTYSEISLIEISITRRVSKLLEILVGGRYFKAASEFRNDTQNFNKGEQKWIDPIIGGRLSIDMTKHLVFTFRADVGGFGVGSDLEWNVAAGIGYRIANITFMGAYRILYADYENGSGENLFVYDMTTSGPGLEMIMHF